MKVLGDWAFVLVAAGSGSRMGGEPKQFRKLGGRPLWTWSARVANELYGRGSIREMVAVFPRDGMPEAPVWLQCPLVKTTGGAVRTESVINGLRATSADFVMIHDAARPFLSFETCEALIGATTDSRGAIPLLGSVDSLKRVRDGTISVVPREDIFRTQTPQAFHRKTLLDILESSADGATDEASLWLDSARELSRVPGDEKNFKITTDFDWQVACSLVGETREQRVGFGYDVHELIPGRRLILGGVEVDSPLGLLGHSDADIVCHAMADALLGAAGEKDIGTLFPASDDRYKDADSTLLLEKVLGLLDEKRWQVVWIDVTLVAQIPRLGATIPIIMGHLSHRFESFDLGEKIGLKVKSGEHVGSVGRGECMTCHTVATIERVGRLF